MTLDDLVRLTRDVDQYILLDIDDILVPKYFVDILGHSDFLHLLFVKLLALQNHPVFHMLHRFAQ
jgi:hypothetical protein